MFGIGDFSRITGLSVKTLRFYHEKGLLTPAHVEPGTGYRFYNDRNVETARVIVALRRLDFPLEEIAGVLAEHDDEADLLDFLERRKQDLRDRIKRDRDIVSTIDQILHHEREARQIMKQTVFEVEEKTLPPVLVAGVRMKCRYDEMGKGFSQIGRAVGRHVAGRAMCLYYDGEYRETDADIEPCMPVRKHVEAHGLSVRELPGGRCVSLVHKGPWTDLGRSYERILRYVKDHAYEMQLPTREVYLKGPGMILRGNPKNYLTEIQILIGDQRHGTHQADVA
ncbi:MAG: MerR family transcriptional regulator [Planctomycetaceae bacterium]